MKIAAITGISGQDGSLLAKFLIDMEYTVYGVIPDSRPSDMFRLRFFGVGSAHRLTVNYRENLFDDYLICSGIPIELSTLVATVFSKLDLDVSEFIESDTSLLRLQDLNAIYGQNTKAKVELGWNYNVTTDTLIDLLIRDEISFNNWLRSN